jgi:hypothetical protein
LWVSKFRNPREKFGVAFEKKEIAILRGCWLEAKLVKSIEAYPTI